MVLIYCKLSVVTELVIINESFFQVHKQVWRLSDWFESEVEKISHKWYRLCMNNVGTNPSHVNFSSR